MQMSVKTKKRISAVFVAVLLLFSLSAAAASTPTQLLQNLQKMQVSAEWEPDVKANQEKVAALLAAVQKLPAAERASIGKDDQAAMLAYFKTLYQIEKKDAAELESLFESSSAAAKATPASSEAPASSQAESSPASSQTESSPASSQAASEPQVSEESKSGAVSIIASVILILLLIAVVAVIFITDRKAKLKAEKERRAAEEKRRAKKERSAHKGKK